jgi:hypothetical protein
MVDWCINLMNGKHQGVSAAFNMHSPACRLVAFLVSASLECTAHTGLRAI